MKDLNIIQTLTHALPVIAISIACFVAVVLLIWLILKVTSYLYAKALPKVYLELAPYANHDHPLMVISKLNNALYGLNESRSVKDKLLLRKPVVSLEIVTNEKEGIRFIVVTPKKIANTVKQLFHSSVPNLKVSEAEQYSLVSEHKAKIFSIVQQKHFAFPLQNVEELKAHDPVGYITSAMTQLTGDEFMSMQIVFYPARKHKASAVRGKIMRNEDVINKLRGGGFHVSKLFTVINHVLFGVLDGVGSVFHGSSRSQQYSNSYRELEYQKQIAKNLRPVRTLSYFEHELVQSIHNKLAEPLFDVEIRCLLAVKAKSELQQRKGILKSAFALFDVPKYQALKLKRSLGWQSKWTYFKFAHRLPNLFHPDNVFSSSELAGLYHFPNSFSVKTENVVKNMSKDLPAPLSLKADPKLDIILGDNEYHGKHTPIGLTAAERERHIYIIGGTGNGKTTMLQYGIVQDMKAAKGLAVVDPHGDLAKTLLEHVPKDRIKDVIYFDPDDVDYPVCINLLELPEGLKGSELEKEKDRLTESVISVFRKVFSEDDTGGHRIEYILRNSIQTALLQPNPTIFTVFELLTNDAYRKQVTKDLPNGTLKNFWRNEMGKAGNMQRVKMSQGVTSKIGRFEFSIHAKRVLGQPKSTIDFDDILASGKILICNFSKGRLGEDTSSLFGTAILAKLQLAANRRDILAVKDRNPFYLYVDEFQNFATMPFVQMLSEARKYKLFLTMAEQSTTQQEEQRMVNVILANVGTVICFRTGSPVDERLVLPLFAPYIEQGEIANLPTFTFYIRLAALKSQEPLSGTTVLLDENGSEKVAEKVKTHSRKLYGKEFKPEQATESKDEPEVTFGEEQAPLLGS